MPLNLTKFEAAKAIVLAEKMVFAALFMAAFVSIGNLISPATAVYSAGRNILGSLGIALASIWQIPLCLYLARKVGMVLPIVINSVLGIFAPMMLGSTTLGWLCPYCWAAKLAEPLMGIEINGTFSGSVAFSSAVLVVLALSLLLFGVLAYLDARSFSKREVK